MGFPVYRPADSPMNKFHLIVKSKISNFRMKLLPVIFALSSAGPSWTVRHAPTSVKISKNSRPNGQEVFEVHKMVSGSDPSHVLNSPGKIHNLWIIEIESSSNLWFFSLVRIRYFQSSWEECHSCSPINAKVRKCIWLDLPTYSTNYRGKKYIFDRKICVIESYFSLGSKEMPLPL